MAFDDLDSIITRGKIDIQATLEGVDVADALKKQRQLALDLLDGTRRKEIKQGIISYAKEMKTEYTEGELDAAADEIFSRLFTFEEPKKDLGYALLEMYINRNTIARRAGITTAALLACFLSFTGLRQVYLSSFEKSAENLVQELYRARQSIKLDLEKIGAKQKDGIADLEITNLTRSVEKILDEADPFFTQYCSDGTAQDDVDTSNFGEVKEKAVSVGEAFNTAKRDVARCKQIINDYQELGDTKLALDAVIGEIRSSKPPIFLAARAESYYESGIISLDNKILKEAKEYRDKLEDLKKNAQLFAVLPGRVEQLYSSVKLIAKKKETIESSDKLYAEAKSYIQSIDMSSLQQCIDKMITLEEVLKQEYVLAVVVRTGEKTAVERLYYDKSGQRMAGTYVIVEALDKHTGKVIPQYITSEETNKTTKVNMWGERVPEPVFLRVGEDKVDNGLLEDKNKIFAVKEKGYMNPEVVLQDNDGTVLQRSGQITDWWSDTGNGEN